MITKLVTKLLPKFFVLVIGLIWLVLLPPILLLLSPFLVYRELVIKYVKQRWKDLGRIVTARSALLAVDDIYGKPECNVVIWFALKGNVSVKEFQKCFADKVLNLRNKSDGDLTYPEFRQYYHFAMGYLFWKWDENFDLNNHIRLCDKFRDEPPTEEQLRRYNETLLSRPWPKYRSPWQFLLVPGYRRCEVNANECARDAEPTTLVLFHLHHGMGDGYSFLKLIMNHLTGGETPPKAAKPKVCTKNPGLTVLLRHACSFALRLPYDFSQQFLSYDINPWHFSYSALTRQFRVGKTKNIPVNFVKQIKNRYKVSFTAVLFAAVTGGIRSHFRREQWRIPSCMHVFVPMPFPNHPDDKLCNHLTGCFVRLPVGEKTPAERVLACHEYFEYIRQSTLPLFNFYFANFGGALPAFMKYVNANNHTSGILSNFPGNEEMIRMVGREVEEFSYNVAPLHGRSGFTFTALTYGDELSIDLVIDRALAPNDRDAEKIVEAVREEFDALWNHAASA